MKSLWLKPKKQVVSLSRFEWYTYFFESFDLLGLERPDKARIEYEPFDDFTKYLIAADDEDHAAAIEEYISSVAAMIKAGADVPPLIRDAETGVPLDGIHRSFAAQSLGLKLAPTIYV